MRFVLLAVALVISSCASSGGGAKTAETDEDGNLLVATLSTTFYGALSTVQSPFRDLGLLEEDIPDKLEAMSSNPYTLPPSSKCKVIVNEMAELDLILGNDRFLAAMAVAESDEGYFTQGARAASNLAISKVGSQVDILPFRGVIRKVSGADAHEKASSKAYQAGHLRRAYLRGLADANGEKCTKEIQNLPRIKNKPSKNYVVTI